MRKHLREIALSCALLASCVGEDDIVAEPAQRDMPAAADARSAPKPVEPDDAFGVVDDGSDCCDAGGPSAVADAGSAGLPTCENGGGDALFVVTKENNGRIYRLSAKTGARDDGGVPDCVASGVVAAAAVDTRGTLWIAQSDGAVHVIDPNTFECQQVSLELAPQAMTFGFDPGTKQERLYALESNTVKAIDPLSLVSSTLGELAHSRLAATADGRLFAVSDPTSGVIVISELSPSDGAPATRWKVPLGFNRPLSGAALHPGGFALFFGGDLFNVPPGAERAEYVDTVFAFDTTILAVAAAPCASLPK